MQDIFDERPLLNVPQVAKRLNISQFTVRAYVNQGRLPRVPGMRNVRIRPSDIDRFIAGTLDVPTTERAT